PTSQYTARIREGRFATGRGHVFSEEDKLRGRMIEALMCDFRIDTAEIAAGFDVPEEHLERMFRGVAADFPGVVEVSDAGFAIPPEGRPLTRMIARGFDAYDLSKAGHSSAI
ncbi:MAG: coproporphyrinogen III oxidase, partial [Paracoccaceae bacterium]